MNLDRLAASSRLESQGRFLLLGCLVNVDKGSLSCSLAPAFSMAIIMYVHVSALWSSVVLSLRISSLLFVA